MAYGINQEGGGIYDDLTGILQNEIDILLGNNGYSFETGASSNSSSVRKYTNKLFGAPYQLLDSVDKRFAGVNSNVGSEYLRNFLLHSPILHIRPGMPHYTGADSATGIFNAMVNAYNQDQSSTKLSGGGDLLLSLAKSLPFKSGGKLQRRMFGFRETYLEYMQYVNYMCRSVANMLKLSSNSNVPGGTFLSNGAMESFESIRWENYRMSGEYVNTVLEEMKEYATAIGFTAIGDTIMETIDFINPWSDNGIKELSDALSKAWNTATDTSIYNVIDSKIKSVMFMVEPVSFDETLSNSTAPSFIESAIDGISGSVGTEIAFITNSRADHGIVESLAGMLGDGLSASAGALNNLVQGVTGQGFMGNLFSGAIQSLKGQKMIYPDIYKASSSEMNYSFSITLTSPYGDIYNYYMNIVVPLLHLIGLVAPRMMTANTIASPFLVQAYIPGMCTCALGIIKSMTIEKNPSTKHVSVHGFPLTVTVKFTIQELYNAMSISPAHDPASFLFNETLNDYMANMAGLIPSLETTNVSRYSAFKNLDEYFGSKAYLDDLLSFIPEWIENIIN